MYKQAWKFFGSTDLSIWLLVCISANLAVGVIYCRFFPKVFNELNYQTFQDWILHNGTATSWWVWFLFFLLFLFSLNTAACTTDRLAELLKKRNDRTRREFAVLVSPSIMHLCFLVLIAGHAVSQFTAQTRQIPAARGATVTLSNATLTVLGSRCTSHDEPGLSGMPKECSASLAISSPNGTVTREIAVLHPILIDGYSIHLGLAGKGKAWETPSLLLSIRKDPGLPLILLGNAVLCVLMLWYFPIILRNRNGG